VLLGAPIWEHREKGSNPINGGRSREWMWLEDRRAEVKALLHV
jgi:hypothetical protein